VTGPGREAAGPGREVAGPGQENARRTPGKPIGIMVKPSGPLCNLGCTYCYYLEKEQLYPQEQSFRMPRDVLERFVRDYVASQDLPEVTFSWQGGEPTLLGLDFFKEAVRFQHAYADDRKISNTIQTNGTHLDDEWCDFLTRHRFLVGLSIDGPERYHDAYRVDKGGKGTFQQVMRGLELLKKHGTDFNTLTVVNRLNSTHPLEIYRFLKETGSGFLQFIPLVERAPDDPARAHGLGLAGPPGPQGLVQLAGSDAAREGKPVPSSPSYPVTPWSVEGRQFGVFLSTIFDEWVRHDVGQVFVQAFDTALAAWTGMEPPLCVFGETCGNALVLEHNGDLYTCDHYVYPEYRLGNVMDTSLAELVRSPEQLAFGAAKRDALPRYCLECPVRFACNGECPKHRFVETPDGEPGLNYLCAGYRHFFQHVRPEMEIMAELLRNRRPPAEIMALLSEQDRRRAMETVGRNDPCPCGSGRKYKRCCGKREG